MNMGMAKMVDAPVVLVADIDKGGVFASIYGTIMLLNEEERARIKGVIINKFRGDVALLQPGIDMIEELTNVPVIGVIPYANLQLEEEDSVSLSGKITCRIATHYLISRLFVYRGFLISQIFIVWKSNRK